MTLFIITNLNQFTFFNTNVNTCLIIFCFCLFFFTAFPIQFNSQDCLEGFSIQLNGTLIQYYFLDICNAICVVNFISLFFILYNYFFRSRNLSQSSDKQGSTRLPPLPMPNFPKFNQSQYQPHRMTYDELANFRYVTIYRH